VKQSRIPVITTFLVLIFFYLPVGVMILFSFNNSRFGGAWRGFTLKWYRLLWSQREIWEALQNTLIVAAGVTLVSVLLGTCAGFALHRYRGRLQAIHYGLVYTPLVIPDILMGISLLLFFLAIGMPLGLFSIFLAQTTFCISYVAMVILARLQDFDFAMIEAAQDLGANWKVTVQRVLVPLLAPGIAAGALLAFTLSIDDFVISFFVAGPGATTLPIRIYSMIKHGSPTLINALSAILLVVTFSAVWLAQKLHPWRSHE